MFLNVLFGLSALLTLLGAFFVVITKNIIHACIFLLMSFIGIAGLYLSLGADFVAAVQLKKIKSLSPAFLAVIFMVLSGIFATTMHCFPKLFAALLIKF